MNIYQNLYDLIHYYVFGNAELSSNMDLVITLISTIACIFMISLPFILIFKCIQLMIGK